MSREKRALDSARDGLPSEKKQRPALASVIVEALKMDSLQKLCSTLEPLLRRVVGEEVDRALAKLAPAAKGGLSYKVSPKRIQGSDSRTLRLQFRNKLALPLFTGSKVEGEQNSAIHVVLQDANTGQVVTTGLEAGAKLDIVVLEGDFSQDDEEDWSEEDFETFVVREREGKRPLLTGDLNVTLKEGVGTLGELTFTDNSSWIRSRKFRLGVRVASGSCEGLRIREGKTDSFSVKDHRGELYKKHYPPALIDEVWRLDKIGKDGAFHKRLNKAGIFTVEDFLRLVVMDPQKLRNILGSGMSNKMWEGTVEHAKTCVLSGKLYVYYADEKQNIGVIFNNIFQLMGLMAGGQYLSVDSLSEAEKVYVDKLVKVAYENWESVVEYDGEALIGSLPQSLRGIDAHTEEPNRTQQLQSAAAVQQQAAFANNHNQQDYSLIQHSRVSSGDQSHASGSQSPLESSDNHRNNYGTARTLEQYHHLHQQQQSQRSENAMSTGLSLQQTISSSSGLPFAAPVSNSYLQQQQQQQQQQQEQRQQQQQQQQATMEWLQRQASQVQEEAYSEDEIRAKSLELLESEDMNLQMQQLLKMFNVATGEQTNSTPNMNLPFDYFPVESAPSSPEKKGSKVGWLKLKAALRWGIFVRKRAAARRARIEEIEEE